MKNLPSTDCLICGEEHRSFHQLFYHHGWVNWRRNWWMFLPFDCTKTRCFLKLLHTMCHAGTKIMWRRRSKRAHQWLQCGCHWNQSPIWKWGHYDLLPKVTEMERQTRIFTIPYISAQCLKKWIKNCCNFEQFIDLRFQNAPIIWEFLQNTYHHSSRIIDMDW